MTVAGEQHGQDFADLRIALRPDVTLSPRYDGGGPWYLLEDPLNSKFHRIGVPESTFIGLLDGKTTLRQAVNTAAHIEPDDALTLEQAISVGRWLVQHDLASISQNRRTDQQRRQTGGKRSGGESTRWNPLFLKVPLFRPDHILSRLMPWTGWLFSTPAVVCALMLIALAAARVLMDWPQLVASTQSLLISHDWIWLGIGWLVIKVLHELAHGVACKRNGGSVREAGVVMILAAPIAYVDLTSSWRFRSKWARIQTAVAGMYFELIVAAVAALLWSTLPPGMLQHLCFQTMILASVTTILFNANPLMRFDGYYVLADWLEMPNLSGESRKYLSQLFRRYVLGLPTPVSVTAKQRAIYVGYGTSALCWRVMVCITILLAAATAFRGAGLVLAVIAGLLWLGPPVVKTVRYFLPLPGTHPKRRLRLLAILGTVGAASYLAVSVVPWPGGYRAPAIVEYAPLAVIRSPADGFVRGIHVQQGDQVVAGQILAVLENEPLRAEVAELLVVLQQQENLIRAMRYDGKTASQQTESSELASLRERIREKQCEIESLVIRSPVSGTVVSHDLDALEGTYVTTGDEVMVVGSEERKEIVVSIEQDAVQEFTERTEMPVYVRIRGNSGFQAPLSGVSPRARREPIHLGLCGPFGGPLAVRQLNATSDGAHYRTDFEHLLPRFEGKVGLTPAQSRALMAGQRGYVRLDWGGRSLKDYLSTRVRHWWKSRTRDIPQVL